MSFLQSIFGSREQKSQPFKKVDFSEKEITEYGQQLIKAANEGALDKVKSILKECPKCINEKNNVGVTALSCAAEYGYGEVAIELINAGAKLDKKGSGGGTPLINAAWSGRTIVLKELINAGAKLDEKSALGRTALMWATYYGRSEIVQTLLAAGSDIMMLDDDGSTALQNAERTGQLECTKLLRDAQNGIFPTLEETGILPPEARVNKFEVERRWTSRTTAEVRKSKWVIE